ncbi:MAG: HAD family hydrolase [Candidatus Latescibacteria bacterium]|jgi:phosphoglycolate phosphatase|nr:HAD family hydrolase [Candidatus Latescibacterota bacterium]
MSNNRFSAVMFDLDGTLLDTIKDLADSMNAVLEKLHLPPHDVASYKYHVGDGIEILARRVLPDNRQDAQTIKLCVEGMESEYEKRWYRSTAYKGIPELLTALSERSIPLTVFSNKPDVFTRKVISTLLPDWSFNRVVGALEGVPKKPDPAGALKIASDLDIAPESFLYVGDTNTDMQTAVAAGMYPVGVLWGFRSSGELTDAGAKTLIAQPLELLDLL